MFGNMRLWCGLFVVISFVAYVDAACKLTGVNQAGAEGGGVLPGVMNTNYIYPKTTADYFVQKGMNIFRLPFLWERLIHTKGANFSALDISTYIDSVNYMSQHAYVILDPHDYGKGFGGKIGESSTTIQDFVDFWVKLANVFKSNPKVIYGLINEPIDNNIYIWREACQAAIMGIRNTGATQTILVPGISYTGAHSWVSSGTSEVLWDIQDPLNNYAYEVHQYLDSDSSGQHDSCFSATVGADRLTGFTAWARAYNKMGFLGEFGGGTSGVCLQAIDNILTYMDQNTDVWLGWTYWAGGPWWGEGWTTLQPNSTGIDRKQWASVSPHIAKSTPSSVVVGKTTPPGPVNIAIYTDSFANGWGDYGWATKNDADTTVKHSGTNAISFTIASGSNLAYAYAAWNTTSYTFVQFWMYLTSGNLDGISFTMATVDDKGGIHPSGSGIKLSNFISTSFSANKWIQVTVSIANFTKGTYDGFIIGGSGSGQTGYLDDIYLVKYVYGSSPSNPHPPAPTFAPIPTTSASSSGATSQPGTTSSPSGTSSADGTTSPGGTSSGATSLPGATSSPGATTSPNATSSGLSGDAADKNPASVLHPAAGLLVLFVVVCMSIAL
eukprot:Phypoly_transcript_05162.p1 GENE.Phypoly_transcript_05162~~Phypoly_transcript_05162.p1  ORF type:complete len:609 (+),score=82.66 Phypoly_transcript_05162:125-1951(+)